MGYTTAAGLADLIDESIASLDMALTYHLQTNHFPPVPLDMVKPCRLAIDFANDGYFDTLIELPEGTAWRGEQYAPVHAIIDGHQLEPFLNNDEDE